MAFSPAYPDKGQSIEIEYFSNISQGVIAMETERMLAVGQFYDLIHSPLGVIEVFFKGPDGKRTTKYYNDKERFVADVVHFNKQGYTCYAGIQPRDRSLLGNGRSGTGRDVAAMRFLYLDIDPVRAKGLEKANASDDEKAHCLKVAEQIREGFGNGTGYKEPILIDSGNGCWLLCPIPEIPVTNDNRPEIEQRLKAWGKRAQEKFRADRVKIDPVFDLPRKIKIVGTKGHSKPDLPGRPRRISSFLS
jgi:hypothetical protein